MQKSRNIAAWACLPNKHHEHCAECGRRCDTCYGLDWLWEKQRKHQHRFINAVLGQNFMAVGYEMESCTTSIVAVEVEPAIFPGFQWLKDRRLILVDTPSFDDTYIPGPVILKQIGKWLGQSYRDKVVLGGLIYLHDISIDRFSGTARKSLVVFNNICGINALSKVAIATTKSNRLCPDLVEKRESRLKDKYWKNMIDEGAQVFKVNEHDSAQARKVVNAILERLQVEDMPILDIQRELVDGKLSIRQTRAWKAARELLSVWAVPVRSVRRAYRRRPGLQRPQ